MSSPNFIGKKQANKTKMETIKIGRDAFDFAQGKISRTFWMGEQRGLKNRRWPGEGQLGAGGDHAAADLHRPSGLRQDAAGGQASRTEKGGGGRKYV